MNTNLYGNRRTTRKSSSLTDSESCIINNDIEAPKNKSQHERLSTRRKSTGKLEPVKSYLRLSNVEPLLTQILPRLEQGCEYNVGHLTITKLSASYQVDCNGEKFKGFQQIFLDDKSAKRQQESFYEEAVRPLVGEFVFGRRNVCVIVHGAEGSGRQRALFGDAVSNPRVCDNSTSIPVHVDDDDLSSLGIDGVSEVDNVNAGSDQKSSPPPNQVSFRNSTSTYCSKLGSVEDLVETASIEDDGIITLMLAEIFTLLQNQYPLSTSWNKYGRPQIVPKNKATRYCCMQPLSPILLDDTPNESVEFYNRGDETKPSLPFSDELFPQSIMSLRISCIEIVDDLASGECSVNDLLLCYQDPDDEFLSFEESNRQLLCADHIKHDSSSGIVYVEEAVEMQCQSYDAVIECLAVAEDSRQAKSLPKEDQIFTDKLCHAVYIISLGHQDEHDVQTKISHQVIITRIDESMSSSASMALHSSYSALRETIDSIATFPGVRGNHQHVMTKLLCETIGGECCTVAVGTINAEDKSLDPLPTLRLGEAMSWIYNTSNSAWDASLQRNAFTILSKSEKKNDVFDDPNSQIPEITQSEDELKAARSEFQLSEGRLTLDESKKSSPSSHVSQLTPNKNENTTEIKGNSHDPQTLKLGAKRNEFQMKTGHRTTQRNPLLLSHHGRSASLPRDIPAEKSEFQMSSNGPTERVAPKRSDSLPIRSTEPPNEDVELRESFCSYNSFSPDSSADDFDRKRNSFIPSTLATSDNPFVQKYAAELNRSSLTQSTPSLPGYDPVKDAKLYLAELELDATANKRLEWKSSNNDFNDVCQSNRNWREMSQEIESTIEATRKRLMERMKAQSARQLTDNTFDLTPETQYQDSHAGENRYPPDYVSVEISSRGSPERHLQEVEEMQHTHSLAIADMRRALRALQGEKDEIVREKNDNFRELLRAREDISRFKAIDSHPLNESATATISTKCSSDKPGDNTNIHVILRVRPMTALERHCRRGYSCIDVPVECNYCLIKSPFDDEVTSEYNFDRVFGADSGQDEVYSCTAEACLPKFMSGISCWVLIYGLKSSGKSFTLGTSTLSTDGEADHQNDGIIPRFTQSLFGLMRNADEGNTFTLKLSVVGLYMEQLFDLLSPHATHAPFLTEGAEGIHIEGATKAFCLEESDIMPLIQRCQECRDGLTSNLNLDLRYFHTFYIFSLEQHDPTFGERKSNMWFASIAAGSHNHTSKKADAYIFKRSSSILKSFVSSLLNEEANVDYRTSKLSSILKDAFVGNSFTTSIITASPSSIEISDTSKAIEFGKKIQKIKKTAAISQLIHLGNKEIDTAELQSKYMSSQSETLLLKRALSEEKSRVEQLTAEKATLEKLLSQVQTNNSNVNQRSTNISNRSSSSSLSDFSVPKPKENTDSDDALISSFHVSMATTVGQQWYVPTRK